MAIQISAGSGSFARPRVSGMRFLTYAQFFSDADQGEPPCPRVRALFARHIKETEARLEELTLLHTKMQQALEAWECMEDSEPTGDSVCALIEALDGNED